METDPKYLLRAQLHNQTLLNSEIDKLKEILHATCRHKEQYSERNFDPVKSEFRFERFCDRCGALLSRRVHPLLPTSNHT